MPDKKRPTEEQYSEEGDEMCHRPSGVRIRFREDGTVGVPIDWNDEDRGEWRQDEVVEKAVEIRKKRNGG